MRRADVAGFSYSKHFASHPGMPLDLQHFSGMNSLTMSRGFSMLEKQEALHCRGTTSRRKSKLVVPCWEKKEEGGNDTELDDC